MSPSIERETISRISTDYHGTMTQCNESSSSFDDSNDSGRSIAKGGVTTPFPWKLHIMLDAIGETEENSIVCWQPHGRAFMVHKPKEFVQEVMPQFFNQTKYASFQRQLNLYGFSRMTHGPDKGAYYHNCFIRGKRHLCKGMIRQKIKGTKVRKSLSPEDEPNFYLMSSTEEFVPQNKESSVNGRKKSMKIPLPQPIVSDSLNSMKPSTSEESIPPIISIAPLHPFQVYDQESKGIVGRKEGAKLNGSESAFRVANPRTVSPQHHNDRWEALNEVKAGDLLFFEGQPFRYLEHFEEIPVHQESAKARLIQYPQNFHELATDRFHDRISKMMFSTESSPPFQNDHMKSTSCLV